MNSEVAKYILSKIDSLPWIDKHAGLVQTISTTYKNADGERLISFPASCDVNTTDCFSTGRYMDLIPDSSKKSLLYFEEITGANFLERNCKRLDFTSDIRLVCWLNKSALGITECNIAHKAVFDIIDSITNNNESYNDFSRIKVTVRGQEINNGNIFTKYTYDKNRNQYLMFPYEYFSLIIRAEYSVSKNCSLGLILGTQDDCIK